MDAQEVVAEELSARGLTLATAESLTGGLLGGLITSVPGASRFYRGGVVAYATEAKEHVLGVDGDLLAAHGPVSRQTAVAMAVAARTRFGADYGLATTGVAGPAEQDGHPVGTLFVGLSGPAGDRYAALLGTATTRDGLRAWAVGEALRLLVEELGLTGA
ncbi:nicotinamide-nucleotide amidohydrolase family protein [Longispora sp. K20-0274]|uniref:CinA family protein n=1 Tax=Longispora sp. K20-0274 TaxID=3088255 RepID=UPI00399A44E3